MSDRDDLWRELERRGACTRASFSVSRRAKRASTRSSVGRLAARLVELCERYGELAPEGTIIDLPLTQEELGAWAGASHAGVAKALQTLRELGWIQTQRKRIVVRNMDALRRRSS